MELKKTRIEYIDTAKAYLIFLVIIGHILIILNPSYNKLYFVVIQAFIYGFHMPAFFIIHGIIFNKEKWRKASVFDFFKLRFYSMIIPYIFFEVIGIGWKTLFQNQSISEGIINLVTIRCNVGSDWFLPAMFIGNLFFLIYVKHSNYLYGIISTVICFILPMFMSEHQFFVVLGRSMLAYGFIMIGNIGKRIFQIEKTPIFLRVSLSFVITVITAIISLKWSPNDFYSCTIEDPVILAIGGISGTILILEISRVLQCKLVAEIGKHTLTIMGTHQLVIYALTTFVPELYGGNIIFGVGVLIAIICFEVPVVLFLDRYLPFCVGRR